MGWLHGNTHRLFFLKTFPKSFLLKPIYFLYSSTISLSVKLAQNWQILHTSPRHKERTECPQPELKCLCVCDHVCVIGKVQPTTCCLQSYVQSDWPGQTRPNYPEAILFTSHHHYRKANDTHPDPPIPRRGERKDPTTGLNRNFNMRIAVKWMRRQPEESDSGFHVDKYLLCWSVRELTERGTPFQLQGCCYVVKSVLWSPCSIRNMWLSRRPTGGQISS